MGGSYREVLLTTLTVHIFLTASLKEIQTVLSWRKFNWNHDPPMTTSCCGGSWKIFRLKIHPLYNSLISSMMSSANPHKASKQLGSWCLYVGSHQALAKPVVPSSIEEIHVSHGLYFICQMRGGWLQARHLGQIHGCICIILHVVHKCKIVQGDACVLTVPTRHWRHESILVACKTLTESSTYVKFVIKFVGTTNLTNILNFREPLNN